MKRFSAFADELRHRFRVRDALLDGEVVTFDETGLVDFRLHAGPGPGPLRRLRPALVERAGPPGEAVDRAETPAGADHPGEHAVALPGVLSGGEGVALFKAVQQLDLEGIVAKRKADQYGPEVRWLKVKNRAYTQVEGRAELFHPR